MEYLEDVVDACEPDCDPQDWKNWYRSLLLQDDRAIDTIWRSLRDLAKRMPGRGTDARNTVGGRSQLHSSSEIEDALGRSLRGQLADR